VVKALGTAIFNVLELAVVSNFAPLLPPLLRALERTNAVAALSGPQPPTVRYWVFEVERVGRTATIHSDSKDQIVVVLLPGTLAVQVHPQAYECCDAG
jgi:hypothetical protein